MGRLRNALWALAAEPPFRLFTRFILKQLPVPVKVRLDWHISPKPAYLMGLYHAAEQAKHEGISEISAIEFGVAGGKGLLAMQTEAEAVERTFGVKIKVYGFDLGTGLPEFIGDHRDHPDRWKPGDYPMDEPLLRSKLTARTTLVLGDLNETAKTFFANYQPPHLGFVAIDVDLYSSTTAALQIFADPNRRTLVHIPLYFDDIIGFTYHHWAGELLAIKEFNDKDYEVKIDNWSGVKYDYYCAANAPHLDHMFVAHDLRAAVQTRRHEGVEVLSL